MKALTASTRDQIARPAMQSPPIRWTVLSGTRWAMNRPASSASAETDMRAAAAPIAVGRVPLVAARLAVVICVRSPHSLMKTAMNAVVYTGQKPVTRRSKKSIAAFKVRKGQPVATMVTLRGERMWEFLDRLMSIALPRVRDFKGVSPKGFDGHGNYTLGLRDQLLFPEIDYMKVDKARGMNVSVVPTAKSDEEARKLLQFIGMPFRQN